MVALGWCFPCWIPHVKAGNLGPEGCTGPIQTFSYFSHPQIGRAIRARNLARLDTFFLGNGPNWQQKAPKVTLVAQPKSD